MISFLSPQTGLTFHQPPLSRHCTDKPKIMWMKRGIKEDISRKHNPICVNKQNTLYTQYKAMHKPREQLNGEQKLCVCVKLI